MVKTVDMVPIASLDVNLDDMVAIGGPGIGEAEVVIPLLAEMRAAGGEDYGTLVIVYRRGADMGDAKAFREKVMAHLSGRKVGGMLPKANDENIRKRSKEHAEAMRVLLFERMEESLEAEIATWDDRKLRQFKSALEREYGRRLEGPQLEDGPPYQFDCKACGAHIMTGDISGLTHLCRRCFDIGLDNLLIDGAIEHPLVTINGIEKIREILIGEIAKK